ncbi:MAG: TIGR02281 family clan AA aspartic protease [Sphingopyxis sp.]|nr:TIGR02281 family clan AA aspartic protease [Sphingopyxis sp.]
MMGRFLVLAAGIAVVSVGMAGVAGRSDGVANGQTSADKGGDDDSNWTTQRSKGGTWSSASGPKPSGASRSASGEVRLDRSGDSHFYADTEIDGTNIRMMVDSGASIIALTRRDAEAIGINVDGLPISGVARTAGGDVPMRTVMLDSVEVDGIEVRRVEAAVVDADMGVSLLGQSFLAKLDAVNVEGDTMTLR